jgi:5-methyltetrahydrofolate--homocysteine methyltransferase
MIVIGERINATRKPIAAALAARDAEHIRRTAAEQAQAGADYIDVNGGDPRAGQEAENMAWLVDLVQAHTDKPLSIDTADPAAAEIGLAKCTQKPILNSVSLEADRLGPLLPLVGKHPCMVVALLMSDRGTPCAVDDRLSCAEELIGRLTAAGKAHEEIIVDPCFLPVSADASSGRAVIDAIAAIRRAWPEVHIGGGLSNISYGLPKRRVVNVAAVCQAVYAGLDAAIVDPCAEGMIAAILAAEAVAGRDEFCMTYVTRMR